MLPLGVLFVLFAVGVWAYCLIDAIMTPPEQLRSLTTMTWALLITVLPVIGAIAWLLAGRPRPALADADDAAAPGGHGPGSGRRKRSGGTRPGGRWSLPAPTGSRQSCGTAREAGQLRPIGPDDDPDFLREIERRFRDDPERDDDY